MQAMIHTKYGPPLKVMKLSEIPKPFPGDDEVLVKVYATCVNFNNLIKVTGEILLARFMGTGFFRPKRHITGNDLAGKVEAVGQNIKQFKPGDEVYGDIGLAGKGTYVEYVCALESALALKPTNLSFAEAAAVPEAAAVALQGLRDKGRIQKGRKVLIYGASGGIGTFAVQIAKYYGAEVTGVTSTRNLDLVRSLGAEHVIDYTQEDFTKNGRQYDLILATAGYRSIFDYQRALSPQGIYVATGGTMRGRKAMAQVFEPMFQGKRLSKAGGQKFYTLSLQINQKDLIFLKELIEAGHIKPVIDRSYPLSQAAEALDYYKQGHARGKVVITMGSDN
jgi:NADPH:quinone reductase-like Zn-dependent oxidoreductase